MRAILIVLTVLVSAATPAVSGEGGAGVGNHKSFVSSYGFKLSYDDRLNLQVISRKQVQFDNKKLLKAGDRPSTLTVEVIPEAQATELGVTDVAALSSYLAKQYPNEVFRPIVATGLVGFSASKVDREEHRSLQFMLNSAGDLITSEGSAYREGFGDELIPRIMPSISGTLEGSALRAEFSPDGETLLFGRPDPVLLDLKSGQSRMLWPVSHVSRWEQGRFDPSGKFLYLIGYRDATHTAYIEMIAVDTGRSMRTTQDIPGAEIDCVEDVKLDFSAADDLLLVSCYSYGEPGTRIFHFPSLEPVSTAKLSFEDHQDVRFYPGRSDLILSVKRYSSTFTHDHPLRCARINTTGVAQGESVDLKRYCVDGFRNSPIYDMQLSRDGLSFVIAGAGDGIIRWRLRPDGSARRDRSISFEDTEFASRPYTRFALAGEGTHLAAYFANQLDLFDLSSGTSEVVQRVFKSTVVAADLASFPGHTLVALEDGEIHLLGAKGIPIAIIESHLVRIREIRVSKNHLWLYVANANDHYAIFSMKGLIP